jgi:hypothetical protein
LSGYRGISGGAAGVKHKAHHEKNYRDHFVHFLNTPFDDFNPCRLSAIIMPDAVFRTGY